MTNGDISCSVVILTVPYAQFNNDRPNHFEYNVNFSKHRVPQNISLQTRHWQCVLALTVALNTWW